MVMYTVNDIAGILQMDVETIRRHIYRKNLKAFKIGKEWRVRDVDLNEFIEKVSNIE